MSILRTTLMEIGKWVASDLDTGRILRVANTFVFKEPVFEYSCGFPFLWDEIMLKKIDKSNNQIRLASATFEMFWDRLWMSGFFDSLRPTAPKE
jgi:hypothetical protein